MPVFEDWMAVLEGGSKNQDSDLTPGGIKEIVSAEKSVGKAIASLLEDTKKNDTLVLMIKTEQGMDFVHHVSQLQKNKARSEFYTRDPAVNILLGSRHGVSTLVLT
jgi:hypothetical protein